MSLIAQTVATLAVAGTVLVGALQPSAERESEPTLPQEIPIFPLQDVMLFPEARRPLHIFEPRYREMVLHALVTDRIIGMVMLEPGHDEEYFGRPPILPVGCAGVIEHVEELPDGRYNIVLRGLTKFRVADEDDSRSFRVATVEAITESLSEDDRAALASYRPGLLSLLRDLAPNAPPPSEEEFSSELLTNALSQLVRMAPERRYRLLEADGALARARALLK